MELWLVGKIFIDGQFKMSVLNARIDYNLILLTVYQSSKEEK